MNLNQVPNDPMINGMKIDEKKVGNFDDVVDNELECSRTTIDEQRCSREVEEKRLALELEIWNKYLKLEAIKGKIRVLGDEKLGIEEEIKELKRKKAVLGGAVEVDEIMGGEGEVSSNESDEMSRLGQLMVENKVLECEKNDVIKKGESWEQKCKDLGLSMLALLERLKSKDKEGVSGGGSKGATAMKDDNVCASKEVGSPSCLPGAGDGELPVEGTPDKPYVVTEDTTPTNKAHLKKRLNYQTERCCDEKIAPPTPAEGKPSAASVIDIIDSDNEGDVHASHRPSSQSEGNAGMMSECDVHDIDVTVDGVNSGEEQNSNRGAAPSILTPKTKRKRDLMVVTSDDECEDYGSTPNRRALKIENSDNEGEDADDNITTIASRRLTCESDESDDDIPISELIKRRAQQGSSQPAGTFNPTRPKRRLVKCGQSEPKDKAQEMENHPDTLETENAANDESSDEDSESSVRSLSSFIVDDEDVEDDEYDKDVEDAVLEGDGGDDSFEMEEGSDDNVDFEEIISKLQSRRHPNSKWTSEGDMLSDFGKNPELCLRAVCALYRQQTNEEKACKASIINNGRGFSKFDATRGTHLGEFLTDGDPNGDLVKSVEELQVYHPCGLEECRRLADRYSKQLFKIYETGEDPFFP